MARHAQPRELAKLKGSDKKNPQRYKKDTPKNKSPLGGPPKDMKPDSKACWHEIEMLALPGVLTQSDRVIFELAANLLAEYRMSPIDFPAAKITHLRGCLASLGMTPADRQKLGTEKSDDENEFDGF